MSKVKYEPIYGLQKPFDDGPEDAEAYGIFGNEVIYYKIDKTSVYCFDTDNQWSHIDGAPNIPFLAMRRIEEVADSKLVTDGMPSFYVGSSGVCTHKFAESDIPVWCNDVDDTCTAMGFINDYLRLPRKPKRWTVADQQAGRLPEVGSQINHIVSKKPVDVLLYKNDVAVLCAPYVNCAPFNVDKLSILSYYEPIETPAEKAQRLKSEWCAKAAKQLKNLEYTSTLTSIYDALLSGELQAPKGE